MITVKTTPKFDAWLKGLKDRITRLRLSRRIDKAQRGDLGDVKPVGEGVFEMREHFGPGWRRYYVQKGPVMIVMLGVAAKEHSRLILPSPSELAAALED